MSIPVIQLTHQALSPFGVHVCPLHFCLYFANKIIYIIFPDSTYMYALIYDDFFSFFLSDLLHSV